jgi:mRNA interferase YafQ
MIYAIEKTNSFKRDYKLIKKRGYKIDLLREVITILADGGTLPAKCRDHELKGKYTGYHECHITPDWLLIYKKVDRILVLSLTRTGTHSDLFV